jgi:hypothetical protein
VFPKKERQMLEAACTWTVAASVVVVDDIAGWRIDSKTAGDAAEKVKYLGQEP